MAEVAMNGSNSEDGVLQERPNLSTDANETRFSSSFKKSKSRSTKKKDDYLDALEQKWESRFAQFDSRLDNICNFMETRQNPGTSDNEAEENLHGDVMSLAPGRSDRVNIGLFSEDEDGTSMRSDNENHNTVVRFSIYLKCQETEEKDSDIDSLKQLFGDDAKTKSVSKSVGLVLDKSQIEILSGSWHCEKPEKVTAYNEQYKLCFPIYESSEKHLAALGTLIETLSEKEVNMDRAVQQVRDIFAMSTKSVDQVARAELKNSLISLPLSSSGVFGDKFEQTLKDRIEKDEQLKELLPELHIGNKPGSFLGKMKNTTSNDWQAKRVKPNVYQNSFKSTPSTQCSFQRTSTVSRPDKSDNKFEKTGTNFRPLWGNQGKNQQRK
ncbi:unnamed protein product [Mytilus coruscus]|uniref:Uncharacterized protein n=1 Tax=Mytilus coruscus TaxID=42192 RepID=A0A6J8CLK5_MYTCO|nr:unnamed protein product [Mytilus coruscus]